MSAPLRVRLRERLFALTCVALIQLALGLALVSGLRVDVGRPRELISRLIEVTLAPPPPPPVVEPPRPQRAERRQQSAAPKTKPAPPGGSVRIQKRALEAPTPAILANSPARAPAGSGTGPGSATGAGSGGGTGGQGSGDDDQGGTDLVQIAGAILPGDYPRNLRERGVGGRVGVLFKVGTDGRVSGCTVTRPSGVPELDALTCRLIVQRFRYRPSTDRFGRLIADEVEGEHDWIGSGR